MGGLPEPDPGGSIGGNVGGFVGQSQAGSSGKYMQKSVICSAPADVDRERLIRSKIVKGIPIRSPTSNLAESASLILRHFSFGVRNVVVEKRKLVVSRACENGEAHLPHSQGARLGSGLKFASRNSSGAAPCRVVAHGEDWFECRLFLGHRQNALACSADCAKTEMRPLVDDVINLPPNSFFVLNMLSRSTCTGWLRLYHWVDEKIPASLPEPS